MAKIPNRSYTRHKTITVEYEDHILVGSGENKSLQSVTRHKNVDIAIHVDTSPFENGVGDCCDTVDRLSEAVVGFQLANVASKVNNEHRIVDATTRGFSTMIEQSINMQSAGHEAEVNSLGAELLQQCEELKHRHDIMTKDYNRIKSRYTSLFGDLNEELRRRILFLMKPCFDFVDQVKAEQTRRIDSDLLSMATVGARESESARIAIQASKIKNNATTLISAAQGHITSRMKMEQMIDEVSVDSNEPEVYYVPAMHLVQSDEKGSESIVLTNDNGGTNLSRMVGERLSGRDSQQLSQEDKKRVDYYFDEMMESLNDGTPRSRRVIETMRSLYDKTELIKYVNQ